MTRFTTDIMTTDAVLPKELDKFLVQGMKTLVSTLFVCIIVPFNLITIVIVLIPMYLTKRYQSLAQSD